jgi:hypothetical protein
LILFGRIHLPFSAWKPDGSVRKSIVTAKQSRQVEIADLKRQLREMEALLKQAAIRIAKAEGKPVVVLAVETPQRKKQRRS